MKYFGAIEAGGTNFICAIGDEEGKILTKENFPTTTPDETVSQAINFFKICNQKRKLFSFGIACFGPLDLNKKSVHYGSITSTPKTAWKNFNIVNAFKKEFNLPINFDTDVNVAALGEQKWGAAKSLDTFIYITVGTGIGVGGIISNKLMHGLIHPEMGHVIIPKNKDDFLESVCPFHKSCLEGLASGPAMMKRWNIPSATDLPLKHKGWDLEAYYLALGITNWVLCLSPEKVIIGGGVLNHKFLLPKIRKNVQQCLNGYVNHKSILFNIDNYIILPQHMGLSGILGAIALAQKGKD